jgi:hypothetical protein
MNAKKPTPEPKPTPSNQHKLRGDSIEPLVYAWEQEALRVGRWLKFHNRKLFAGPMLSMLVAWYMERDQAERDEIVQHGCKLYEEMTAPRPRKGDDGNHDPDESEPVFRGGKTKGKLGIPIPKHIDSGPKRRADQHNALAEVDL